jgi:hypothetical protein
MVPEGERWVEQNQISFAKPSLEQPTFPQLLRFDVVYGATMMWQQVTNMENKKQQ